MRSNKFVTGILTILFFIVLANLDPASVQAASTDYRTLFDADYYYRTYPDVAFACGADEAALYAHFVRYGMSEGRCGSGEFDVDAYRARYSDLSEALGDNVISYYNHYLSYGRSEGRIATSNGAPFSGVKKKQKSEVPAAAVKTDASAKEQAESASGEAQAESVAQSASVVGSYTTYYEESESRATNIKVAAQRINGVVLQPGETFSFSSTILPRTSANGYVSAPVIINKKMSQGVGGGICQVSSTLYAALLTAGIPATERHPHSLAISYLPAGMDATISGTSKDLKFENIYEKPLKIIASAQSGKLEISLAFQE